MLSSGTTSNKKRSRITRHFNLLLLALYAVITLISLPATYWLTQKQIMDQANSELSLIVDMIRSVRNVVREETRPHFLPKGEFFPPVVSSTVMAKTVATKFAKLRPEYYIRIISDNPLNPENLPDVAERTILTRFRSSEKPKRIIETGILKNQRYLISAAPSVAKAGCMRCHGDADKAPKEITDIYGKDSGFGFEIGSTVGASVVGVPLADLKSLVLTRSLTIIGILTLLFSALFLSINLLVKKSILDPLLAISASAQAVSRGKLDQSVMMDRNDEIGDLSYSFELMRRSLVAVVKKLRDARR
ncbi:MAG TPA: DUF3365 domain-containing protein [Gammaproteobacteria bacterium]|nr:DUF3365 domain-containing protein [Gammaproteobacteria bacterium]